MKDSLKAFARVVKTVCNAAVPHSEKDYRKGVVQVGGDVVEEYVGRAFYGLDYLAKARAAELDVPASEDEVHRDKPRHNIAQGGEEGLQNVVVLLFDEYEYQDGEERLGQEVQKGCVLHPLNGLEEPVGEHYMSRQEQRGNEDDIRRSPELRDCQHADRKDCKAHHYQQTARPKDVGENLRDLFFVVATACHIPRCRVVEAPVRHGLKPDDDRTCKGNLAEALRAYHPRQVGQGDKRKDIARNLQERQIAEVRNKCPPVPAPPKPRKKIPQSFEHWLFR